MKALITGGAGFIGSHLADLLLCRGWSVVSADVTENIGNISHLIGTDGFDHIRMDVNDTPELCKAAKGCDMIFHMAANSDIRASGKDPDIDFRNTLTTTKSVLECMRINGPKRLFFPSTSAVYGDRGIQRLSEDLGCLEPVSYYGACKLASEALVSAYTYMNSFSSVIFRFPNVAGPRLTHGVIFDFIDKLRKNRDELEILGDGNQDKQYVHVLDLVRGIVKFTEDMASGTRTYNISTGSSVTVRRIADIVCEEMGVSPKYIYTGGRTGWKGDIPCFRYDISKAEREGWVYNHDSEGAVRETVRSVLG